MPDYDELLLTPEKSRFEAPVVDPVLIVLVETHLVIAAKLLRAKKHLLPLIPARVYTIRHQERPVSLVGPALGAPAAVMVLERCAAQGVKHVIVLGVAGSLQPEVKIGDFVVPTSAKSDEGTSVHYQPEKFPPLPGEKALAAVEATLKEAGLAYHRGPIWTSDAFYQETRDQVKRYGEAGLLAVEMEHSALFTVARFRGMELAGLLVISDELASLKWKPGYTQPAFLNSFRLSCRLGLNAALKLAENDRP